MYPVQIQGNTFADNFNRAWLQSLQPEVFYSLWARRGVFGIPMTGTPIDSDEAFVVANRLAAQGLKVTQADLTGKDFYSWMLALKTEGYGVYSLVGEPNPDWATAPPNQSLPGVPPYNSEGHTGIVSFELPDPYTGPVIEPTKYVGPRANNDNGGEYNGINGAESKFTVGQENTQDGIKYVFIGGSPCWQYIGRG